MPLNSIRKFFSKPYNWLLICSLILVAWPFSGNNVAVHFADTYFVLSAGYFFIPIAILIIVLWLMYRLTNRLMFSKILSYASIFMVFCFFGILFSVWLVDSMRILINPELAVLFSIYLLLAAQLVFILNLLLGVIKGKR
ncbi:hypothetical protein [uncultured Chitinophaga sp.]|uniref:hypothetical protein n=1 Tax=uncultured Chitinophaga sp. TaxID=339340 RepID=UPI0025DD31F5|nr:hypothetical protein [uncultured Chitinophaga sp.]